MVPELFGPPSLWGAIAAICACMRALSLVSSTIGPGQAAFGPLFDVLTTFLPPGVLCLLTSYLSVSRKRAETLLVTVSERGATRMDDRTSDASMERRKKEGYF